MPFRLAVPTRATGRLLLAVSAAALAVAPSTLQGQARVAPGAGIEQVDHIRPSAEVDVAQLAALGVPSVTPRVRSLGQPNLDASPHYSADSTRQVPQAPLG